VEGVVAVEEVVDQMLVVVAVEEVVDQMLVAAAVEEAVVLLPVEEEEEEEEEEVVVEAVGVEEEVVVGAAEEEEVDQLLTMAKHAKHILAGDFKLEFQLNRMILQQKS
jgi:hypothetical protein